MEKVPLGDRVLAFLEKRKEAEKAKKKYQKLEEEMKIMLAQDPHLGTVVGFSDKLEDDEKKGVVKEKREKKKEKVGVLRKRKRVFMFFMFYPFSEKRNKYPERVSPRPLDPSPRLILLSSRVDGGRKRKRKEEKKDRRTRSRREASRRKRQPQVPR